MGTIRYVTPPEVVEAERKRKEELIKDAERRYGTGLPPGYKRRFEFYCSKCGAGFKKKKLIKNPWRAQGYCSWKCRNGVPKSYKKKAVVRTRTASVKLPDNFYTSREWRELRYKALKIYERKCMTCFRSNVELHVDHIKPISKYPELALVLSNLQILCIDCNLGKGNKDCIDWRPSRPECLK